MVVECELPLLRPELRATPHHGVRGPDRLEELQHDGRPWQQLQGVVEQELLVHVDEALVLAEHLPDAEAGEGAQDDGGRRRHGIDDVRSIGAWRAEEQLVGGDALVAVQDRLSADEPHGPSRYYAPGVRAEQGPHFAVIVRV